MKKNFIIFLLILTLFFIFLSIININNKNYKVNLENNNYSTINKIIIIGDSRMELIERKKERLNLPNSILFDAKSGAKINWLYKEGIPKFYQLTNNKKYNYHVILNLGVNDLSSDISVKSIVNNYFDAYKKLIINNKNINFYILSINPIDENKLWSGYDLTNKRTTKKVIEFNKDIKKLIKKENINNLEYCDSYNSLDFEMPDGLHYTTKTDNEIMAYIIEKCVNYK